MKGTYVMQVRSGFIMDVDSANEKRRYKVKSSLIGWTHTQNGPYLLSTMRSIYVGHDNKKKPSNGSWCIGIKGEMSGTVCVTFTWDIYIYMSCL